MVEQYLIDLLSEKDEEVIIENLLEHFDSIENEFQNFMDLLVDKLPEMVITWEQPWYQRSSCLTRPMKVNENIDNELESYRTDRFTKAESDIVKKNWKAFIKVYNVPNKPHYFTEYKLEKKYYNTPLERNVTNVRQFVTAFMAQGVQRNIYQVYQHLLRKYSFTRKGPYSPEEEKLLKICVARCPNKALKVLSSVLRRQPRNLYYKMEELINGKDESIKHKRWTLKRSSRLLRLILRHTGLSLSELKNRRLEKPIWDTISAEMKRTSANLREFWYHRLHVQLFVERDLKYKKLRKKILRKLNSSSYRRWSDINWKQLAQEFPDGCTSDFLYDIISRLFQNDYHLFKKPLKDVIEFAFKKIVDNKKDMRLKRLKLNEHGKLEPIAINDVL